MGRNIRSPRIFRITIDEKLSEDLIRILVSKLQTDLYQFSDETHHWGKETESFITPKNHPRKLGIPNSLIKEFPWDIFQEGQVYVSGEFIYLNANNPCFTIERGVQSFVPIADISKDIVKKLYSEVLTGGGDGSH